MPTPNNTSECHNVQAMAQQFLYAMKRGEAADALIQSLTDLDLHILTASLKNDDDKKAFWLNVYNGCVQRLLLQDPDQYKNRSTFFTTNQIEIAGQKMSLDFIEHGILRRSKIKLSFGYANKLFPSLLEKQLRVDELDFRIHFALNCGAISCPPIAFYDVSKINQQLELATMGYLEVEADYDDAINEVRLPSLFNWFRADFGGNKGSIKILQQFNIVPADRTPSIRYKPHDWTLALSKYTDL